MIRENLEMKMADGYMRKVRVALPDDYEHSGEIYPVLYMFDGQNLFEKEDSSAGEIWNVHGAMEKLAEEKNVRSMVIIGIDNAGDRRLDEYGPWPFQAGKYKSRGEGKDFADFFVQSLIPELETKYRISQEAKGRFLAGSSMGALISAYIGTRYPETFSSLGIFSIASWVSEKPFLDYLKDEGSYRKTRFFIQVGTEEVRDEDGRVDYAGSQKYISNSLNYLECILLQGAKIENISLYIGAGKTHNEEAWAGYMPEFLLWLNERL